MMERCSIHITPLDSTLSTSRLRDSKTHYICTIKNNSSGSSWKLRWTNRDVHGFRQVILSVLEVGHCSHCRSAYRMIQFTPIYPLSWLKRIFYTEIEFSHQQAKRLGVYLQLHLDYLYNMQRSPCNYVQNAIEITLSFFNWENQHQCKVNTIVERIQSLSASISLDDEDISCNICLCSMKDSSLNPTFLECGHWFHISCITMWFHRKLECPTCRSSIEQPLDPTISQLPVEIKRRPRRGSLCRTYMYQ